MPNTHLNGMRNRRRSATGFWLLASGFSLLVSACSAPAPKAKEAYGERALRDPIHYAPDMQGTDISGGGTGELDKASMRKDLEHVFMP